MKNFRVKSSVFAFVAAIAASVSSCALDSDYKNYDENRPSAIVTVKTLSSGETYFQVDEKTTLLPVDWKNPYASETRALVRYTELPDASAGLFTKSVKVNWIDSVLTKKAVPFTEEFKKGANDPVELIPDWLTVCEDGYMTVHFATWWGPDGRKPHFINLGIDPQNPRDLYFRHDKNGDDSATRAMEGIVAFKIDEFLTDVKDGDELTFHWTSFDGEKEAKLKYSGRFGLSEK